MAFLKKGYAGQMDFSAASKAVKAALMGDLPRCGVLTSGP